MKPAEALSKIFHPLLVIPVSALFFLNFSGIGFSESLYWFSLWIALSLIPTTGVVWLTGERGLNIRSRENRFRAFLTGLGSLGLSLAVFNLLSAPSIVMELALVGLLAGIVFSIANHFNKVSIHTGSVTATAAVYTLMSPRTAVFLSLSSVLVGWSRVELECHTPVQVAQGGMLGLLCGIVFLAL